MLPWRLVFITRTQSGPSAGHPARIKARPIVSDDGQAIVRHGEIAEVSHMTQPDLRFEAPIGVDVKGEMRSCVETPGSVDFFETRSPA